jgi:hypothetical protein
MKRVLKVFRPSPAMVVACMALLFSLGGVGYAAVVLPANSVGTKQLKKNAVTASKVKDHSLLLKDFKSGQIPAGPTGAIGATGPSGPQGTAGTAGQDLTYTTALQTGQTLTGVYSTAGPATGGWMAATIEFRPRLPANIPAANFHYVGTANANCPGPGQAAPGHMCVYERWINAATFNTHVDPASSSSGSAITTQGVSLLWDTSSTQANTRGVWAVQPN